MKKANAEVSEAELILGVEQMAPGPLDYASMPSFAAENEFSWVEFKFEPEIFGNPGSSLLRRIKAELKKFGLDSSVHSPYHGSENIGSVDDAVYERSIRAVEDAIRFAHAIGAKLVNVHPGDAPRGEDEMWSICVRRTEKAIRKLSELARSLGVRLSVENRNGCDPHLRKFGVVPHELLSLKESLGKELCFTLDWGHVLTLKDDPLDFAQKLGWNSICLCHMHTNDGSDDQHLPVSGADEGVIKFFEEHISRHLTFPVNIEVRSIEDILASKKGLLECWAEARRRLIYRREGSEQELAGN